MIISICIPCMNRTHDLKKVMPKLIEMANYSPPVEIVVVNYNSTDDLDEYISTIKKEQFKGGSFLTYRKYSKGKYYQMAHARNLSVLASGGEYIVISSTDIVPRKDFMQNIRKAVKEDNYVWLKHNLRFVGVLCIKRDEFIEAGGFDERFKYYGKEDKDLLERLKRRGGKHKTLKHNHLSLIFTSKKDKLKNYKIKSRSKISRYSKSIYEENIKNNILVTNKGREWGQWE